MNVNKKFDRFKQWAGEKMGGEAKTSTSDNFKAMEAEMNLRHEGMEKLQKSMNLYVKAMAKKSEVDADKSLPVGFVGSTMVGHGQDFQQDSEFGSCLISMGRANEALARRQEAYVANATSTWLESLERSLAQMKEYQAARKKLEARRLAYDASLAKTQKAKKEDFRIEEELRAQKAKYEESSEDVYRRMEDIREAEVETVQDLTQFLDAQLSYYDSCRDIMLDLKRNWPAAVRNDSAVARQAGARPRSNTAHSYSDRFNSVEEEPAAPKAAIPSTGKPTRADSLRRDFDASPRPAYARPATEPPSRDYSPDGMPRVTRVTTDGPAIVSRTVSSLRPVNDSRENGSKPGYYDRSDSPTASIGSSLSRTASWSTADNGTGLKKAPPPPPSRAKKPAPPPPVKRAAFSTSQVPQQASQHTY